MNPEFKKLGEVDVAGTPAEDANVLIEENGQIKRAPKNAVAPPPKPLSWEDIQNKPFYTETEVITVLENQAVTAGTPAMIGVTKMFGVGDTVEVVYNGSRYVAVARYSQGGAYVGNASLVGAGDDTGEPFLIAPARENTLGVACINDATVSVYITIETVHKLDAKYLPNVGGYDLVVECDTDLLHLLNTSSLTVDPAMCATAIEKMCRGEVVNACLRMLYCYGGFAYTTGDIPMMVEGTATGVELRGIGLGRNNHMGSSDPDLCAIWVCISANGEIADAKGVRLQVLPEAN